jgi:anti-anti-sigma regulatory factor
VESNYEFVSDELFELVEYVTSNGPVQVVLDLWNVRKLDDWGLAMLRAFHETIDGQHGTVILCRIQPAVADFLGETGMVNGFHMRETRGQAIRQFSDRSTGNGHG